MLYFIRLYHTIPYHTILYHTIYIILYYTILYYTVLVKVLSRITSLQDRLSLRGAEILVCVVTLQLMAYACYWIQNTTAGMAYGATMAPESGTWASNNVVIWAAYGGNLVICTHGMIGLRWCILACMDSFVMASFVLWFGIRGHADYLDIITALAFVFWGTMTIAAARSTELTDR